MYKFIFIGMIISSIANLIKNNELIFTIIRYLYLIVVCLFLNFNLKITIDLFIIWLIIIIAHYINEI
jgi:hypothetical protein